VIEDHQLVAFAALGGNVLSLKRDAVVRRDDEVVPPHQSVSIRRLEDEAPGRFSDRVESLDLRVILLGDGFLLF
jgi:hypothetical protein